MNATALRKFLSLSWGERFLLVEAFFRLGVTRAGLLLVPFRWIAPHLGHQVKDDEDLQTAPEPSELVLRVAWAVETMARRTPWESACLAQAITAKGMLRIRGFASTLYLGMKKDGTGALQAHAWLRSGNRILIGSSGHEAFTVLSAFAD